jgi:hypothetical protein
MTELQQAYNAYLAALATYNSVYSARFQPEVVTIPAWPALAPGASDTCILSDILARTAFITRATLCIVENVGNVQGAQDCINYWHGICVAAIAGCVAQS